MGAGQNNRIMAFPITWQLTMGAAVFAGIISYLLLLGALLSDRNKEVDPIFSSKFFIPNSIDDDHWFSSLNTEIFDRKEAVFTLINDKEWRIKPPKSAPKRRRRSISEHDKKSSDRRRVDDFDCDHISKMIPSMDFLAAGWTKAVYKAKTGDNRAVAIKTVDLTGQDMSKCLDERRKSKNSGTGMTRDDDVEWCYQKASKKLIKEIALLKLLLDHPNVVKVFGYCVPKQIDPRIPEKRVSLVTEIGEPVNLIRLLQTSWEERLRVVLAVTRLTDYVSQHPAGSLVMNDMRRQQFVISSSGELKLVDVDDVGMEEPNCNSDSDCRRYLAQILGDDQPNQINLTCTEKKICSGANEIRNIYNAARHFTTFLLPYGAPHQLQSDVDRLVDAFRFQSLSASQLRSEMESLVQKFSSGSYLANEENDISKNFAAWPNSDLPGQFDYSCESSLTQVGCSLSVANLREARQLCAAQPTCRAFVWTDGKTWTGRTVVHFKNDVRTPSKHPNATLFVKLA